MIARRFLYVLVFFTGVTFCLGQENEFIRGEVIDNKTGEPVVFASVLLMGKARGVITNLDGGFRLPVRYRDEGLKIAISSMGYQTMELDLAQLSAYKINTIRLPPEVMELTEAVVKGKKRRGPSAVQIVRRAIKAIPKNYPRQEFSTIGYYRDYQLRKDNYVNLNEAILEVIDKGFSTNDHLSSKVRIYDFSENKAFKQDFEGKFKYDYKYFKKFIDKAYLFNYGGNEFTILRVHDAIRNYRVNSYDFVNVLERDLIENHFFKKEKAMYLDGEPLYHISFRQSFLKYLVSGNLYISKGDYAIHKMEYTLYDRYRKLKGGAVNKNGDDHTPIFDVTTEYKRKMGVMYPNYISFYNTFEVTKPPEFVVKEVVLDGPKGCFSILFNQFVDPKTAAKKMNYDLRLDGKKIGIAELKVYDEEVELYPKLNDKDYVNLVRRMETLQRKRVDVMKALQLDVSNVLNRKRTAKVNVMKYNTYKQFREFFVQEVKPNGSLLRDTLFMKKDMPIFKDQSTVKPPNFEEYWMNTPLKKTTGYED